jgi:TolB-like protein/Flp pilus assembly protein TadD
MALLAELRRRNVFRVAIAYLVAAWVLLQVADVLLPALRLPDWTITLVAVLLVLGFVPAMIGAWVFELTPEGLRRESEVDRTSSITRDTGRKLNIATIALVMVGIALLAADRYLPGQAGPSPEPAPAEDAIPVIAILPFQATGSDDGGFLATGLHDDLLTMLHKIGAYRVLSRTSVMEYANTTKKMPEIGAELGASHILEGGVQARGNRVRINAQLIDAAADEHIWADIYDEELTATNLFDIQAKLATAIAGQLRRTLSPEDRAVVDEVPTENTEAYAAYLRALDTLHNEGLFNNRRAVEQLEEAVEADPTFALAWARLSEARSRMSRALDDQNTREAALSALAEARALKPDLLEAEIAWAVYLYHGQFEYAKALATLEALGERGERNPDVLQLKAWLYRRLGRYEEAYETMLASYALDPRDPATIGNLVDMAVRIDDCDAAGEHAASGMEVAPDNSDVLTHLAIYELECSGDAASASELLSGIDFASDFQLWTARNAAWLERDYERMLELADIPLPDHGALSDAFNWDYKAYVLRQLGRDTEARALYDRLNTELAELAEEQEVAQSAEYANAMILLASAEGDAAATRSWIERHRRRVEAELKGDAYFRSFRPLWYATRLVDVGLHDRFPFVDATPAFDPLRDNPGYIELRERFGD